MLESQHLEWERLSVADNGLLTLVVDDSEEVRKALRRILEPEYHLVEAANGREAFDILRSQGPFALALVDWDMPEMNGYELLRAIRMNSALDGMPVIMITAEIDMPNVKKALDAGAREYIMKPFTPDIVFSKLRLAGFMLK